MNWRPFGYKGEPLTCLWCGRKLRYQKVIDDERAQAAHDAGLRGHEAYEASLAKAPKAGAYQDDSFDTMSCGYLFGLRLAELGRRLQAGG